MDGLVQNHDKSKLTGKGLIILAQEYGFFNSSGGDRVYDASDFARYFGSLVSNGVFTRAADNLKVIASGGMNIAVQPGSAWVNGCCYENTEPLTFNVSTAHGTNPRIDRVALRWSNVDRNMLLTLKTGAASETPTAPALTRTSDIYELGLADIAVGKGVVSIAETDITDTRLNSALCGTVNSLIGAVYE
jgi:hypothetical protein